MLILTCKTKDKKGQFVILPSTKEEAIFKAIKMNNLGCEPIQLYIGENDETKDKKWIMNKFQEYSVCND